MSISKQAINGVKWTTVATATIAICMLLKISVLTRFLDKADFGLIALVTFILGFMDLFMDMGITSAILHKQNIQKREYASLYWLNVIFSLILFALIIVLSPFLASFYDEPLLVPLIALMGVGIIFSAVGRQYKTILQKEIEFKTIALVEIIAAVISLILAIVLAIENFGVYALVYSALAQYFISNVLFFIIGIKKQPLLFHYNYAETKPFLKIGIYQVGSQVVNYFNRDLDILIVGKFFGTDLLGGYSLAKQLVFRPAQILNPIFTRVASPILAKMQSDIQLLKTNYLKLLNAVSSINIPIYTGIIIFAPLIVTILYGEQYLNIVPVVRILSVYMIFRAIGNPVGSLVIATGRTDLEFFWNVFTLIFLPIAIILGAQFSIEAVAIAITVAMAILLVPSWRFLVYRLTGASLKEYLVAIIPKFKYAEIRALIKKK